MKKAILIIHGVGHHGNRYAENMIEMLKKRYEKMGGNSTDLIAEPVVWSPLIEQTEKTLWDNMTKTGAEMDFTRLRRFIINFMGEAIAYQPVEGRKDLYDKIHNEIKTILKKLARNDKAGPNAPLCVIAHSLGSVIMSNFIWDLQKNPDGETPLERGKTFQWFFTMGSPLAIWNLRFSNFGKPISTENWINFYDKDDIFGYPLSNLNKEYNKRVIDKEIDVGNILVNWNPLSHTCYWTDGDVINTVVDYLIKV